ncbi:cannabinoid receptor 1-like [Actinia tenebrosa]|uniref:Cannabinoid receptor 1-like n=1 Tax=Actinia tenebrosa TaxID=6105 RepID=A0A6P8IHW0_ACTTE|nr:cannabinoid receptor 1-like [Actinia tenebrosa]
MAFGDNTCLFVQGDIFIEGKTAFITDVLTAVLNALFAIIAVLVNGFVLYIIRRSEHLKNAPSNILLCCLAFSDMIIGLICQTSFVLYKVCELLKSRDIFCYFRLIVSCFGWVCAGVSLLTISSIIVDRLLALRLHLRYNTFVTAKRVYCLVVIFWIFCIFMVSLRFSFQSDAHWTLIPLVLLIIALVLTLTSYANIFCIVKQHHTQIIDLENSMIRRNHPTEDKAFKNNIYLIRYKRTAATMIYVLAVFLICYLPFLCTMFAEASLGYVTQVKIAYDYASTIVFISSSINPVLYCCRMREIRNAITNSIWVLTKWDFRRGSNVGRRIPKSVHRFIEVKPCSGSASHSENRKERQ